MVSLAASGGGSSHPVHSLSTPLYGYGSITELYESAIAFLETVDRAKKEDLEVRLKSLVHIDGPLNPKIVGKFFQVVCQESVRNQPHDKYDHLREQLEKLFGVIPQIKSSFGSHVDDSTMIVHVTDIKGESKTLHFPTRMVINSAVMRDFMEKRAAGGAGDAEPAWTFQLPPSCTFELFHDYLSFYQTGAVPKENIEKSCQLLKLADYLVDDNACTSIVEQLEPYIREFASLDVLKMMINTLGASIPGKKLIDASLSLLLKEAIDKKQSDRFFAELAGSELKEVLAGLDISLSLEGSNITDELVKQLTIAFPAMTELSIRGSNITDAGLDHLRALTFLKTLDLSNCKETTGEGLAHLSALTFLTSLNLAGCTQITNNDLAIIATLASLTSLNISLCFITGVGLAHLSALTFLTSLNLAGCIQIKNNHLAIIAKLTSLTGLNLSGCCYITNAGLNHLAALTSLTSLDLSRSSITGEGLDRLAGLTSLTSLNLSGCSITDADLDRLRVLTSISKLYLKRCYGITDAGLAFLGTLPLLRHLNLGCTSTSAEGRRRLAKKGVEIFF